MLAAASPSGCAGSAAHTRSPQAGRTLARCSSVKLSHHSARSHRRSLDSHIDSILRHTDARHTQLRPARAQRSYSGETLTQASHSPVLLHRQHALSCLKAALVLIRRLLDDALTARCCLHTKLVHLVRFQADTCCGFICSCTDRRLLWPRRLLVQTWLHARCQFACQVHAWRPPDLAMALYLEDANEDNAF